MPDFPLSLRPPAKGGPRFRTTIVESDEGVERRNADWGDPRWEWDLEFDLGAGELVTLENFFNNRKGRLLEFDFRRPYDLLDPPDPIPTYPARFADDELSYDYGVNQVVSAKIVELLPSGRAFPLAEPSFPDKASAELVLRETSGTQERASQWNTLILGEDAVSEIRQRTREQLRRRWVIEYAALTLEEVVQLEAFFVARRGRAQAFDLRLYNGSLVTVRFDSDAFDAEYQPMQVGAVGQLPLIEVLDLVDGVGYLARAVRTTATLFTFTAPDLSVARLTNASRQVVISGSGSGGETTIWEPAPIEASEIEQVIGATPDNLELTIPYAGQGLTRANFLRGKWRDADVNVKFINYLNAETIAEFSYRLGDAKIGRLSANCELRSLSWFLSQEIGDTLSPTCRVRRFGDAQCGVDLSLYTYDTVITAVTSSTVLRLGLSGTGSLPSPFVENAYAYGELIFLEGPMSGRRLEIKSSTTNTPAFFITLQLPLQFEASVGQSVRIIQGCDRTFPRCIQYNNAVRFAGEPHAPTATATLQIQRAQ